MNQSTVDLQEVAKFAEHSNVWWNKEGPLRTLHEINPARLDFIKRHHQIENSEMLDVGCGGGILTESLALYGGKLIGLDADEKIIAEARLHAQATKLEIDYQCCPLEGFLGEAVFDAVTCMEMLEHVPEPQEVINHCARVLKPGGFLFLSTINRTLKAYATVIVAAEYIMQLLPKQTHDFNKFIKPSELVAMTRTAGLTLCGMAGINYNPLSKSASLQERVDVNYLVCCQKIG